MFIVMNTAVIVIMPSMMTVVIKNVEHVMRNALLAKQQLHHVLHVTLTILEY
jgi:hypothetical protein